jgi:hypothetical protein
LKLYAATLTNKVGWCEWASIASECWLRGHTLRRTVNMLTTVFHLLCFRTCWDGTNIRTTPHQDFGPILCHIPSSSSGCQPTLIVHTYIHPIQMKYYGHGYVALILLDSCNLLNIPHM